MQLRFNDSVWGQKNQNEFDYRISLITVNEVTACLDNFTEIDFIFMHFFL